MNELCGDAVFVFTLLVRGCARCCSLLSLPSTFIALPTMESRPGFVPTHLPFSFLCFPFAWLRRVWCPPWVDRVPCVCVCTHTHTHTRVPWAEFPMPCVTPPFSEVPSSVWLSRDHRPRSGGTPSPAPVRALSRPIGESSARVLTSARISDGWSVLSSRQAQR